jgi:xanthine dehydrogenase/oxidase
VYAAFVCATKVHGIISSIDASKALKIPGVVAFYSAKDIPGKNTFMPLNFLFVDEEEEIFCSSKVLFHNQPVGIILAETFDLANKTAKLIDVKYESIEQEKEEKILTSIEDVLKYEPEKIEIFESFCKNPLKSRENTENVKHSISGEIKLGMQFHFTMEPQTCICIPNEEGLEVYSATQWMDLTQSAISEVLNEPMNKIHLQVKRLGGGFGTKISRSSQIACATALAAFKLNRPVRFIMELEANMEIVGKRYSCLSNYQVKIDELGKIQELNVEYIENYGCSLNEVPEYWTTPFISNCYNSKTFQITAKRTKTDIASNTWCRGPGALEGFTIIENIMEHIARKVKKDPVEVRMENISEGSEMKKFYSDFIQSVNYYERKREIDAFNNENRWIKRGIATVPIKYPIEYFGTLHAFVAIYQRDGSVSASVGGIEMGQGLNTKVLQTISKIFQIPMNLITIKSSSSLLSPNDVCTGASIGSEISCYVSSTNCKLQELLMSFKFS